MKRTAGIILSILLLSSFIITAGIGDEADRAAIKKSCMNYIEGWYEGDAARMDNALHPELIKRGIMSNPRSNTVMINTLTKSNMILYTKMGAGKLPEDQRNIELKILDIYQNTATAKISSAKFIDYVHLAKIDGKWSILNVIWEPLKK